MSLEIINFHSVQLCVFLYHVQQQGYRHRTGKELALGFTKEGEKGKRVVGTRKRLIVMIGLLFTLGQEGRTEFKRVREIEKMVESMDQRSRGSQRLLEVGYLWD